MEKANQQRASFLQTGALPKGLGDIDVFEDNAPVPRPRRAEQATTFTPNQSKYVKKSVPTDDEGKKRGCLSRFRGK